MKCLTGKTLTLKAAASDTVGSLKKKIQLQEDIPAETQDLIYQGTRLTNDQSVASFKDEATLSLRFNTQAKDSSLEMEKETKKQRTKEPQLCLNKRTATKRIVSLDSDPGMKMEHGMDPKVYKNFKQVYSGHFHHKSSRGNITYLGNPYQMFWNDYADIRGFHLYEPASNKLRMVKNPYDIFKKIYYNDVDKTMKLDYSQFKDTFVKVIVEEKKDYYEFEKVIDSLYASGVYDIKIVESLVSEDETEDISLEVKDTLTLLNEYIDEVEMSVDKSSLKKLMRSLYMESCELV